jgi:hypothetical protein
VGKGDSQGDGFPGAVGSQLCEVQEDAVVSEYVYRRALDCVAQGAFVTNEGYEAFRTKKEMQAFVSQVLKSGDLSAAGKAVLARRRRRVSQPLANIAAY